MVSDTLLLEASPGELRAALLAAGQVWQVEHERAGTDLGSAVGAVICGRVRRIDPGMNAAFVDLGGAADGFLRARDALDAHGVRERGGRIERLVQEGALVPVRITGGAYGGKGPVVSMAALRDEREVLLARCQGLGEPGLMAPGPDLVSRLLSEIDGAGLVRVVSNDRGVLGRVAAGAAETVLETPEDGLFESYGVETAIGEALARRVAVPGGGSLTFDETEALTVVDMDSGSHRGRAGRGARDVNLQAVREIARQLRLRNIGGMVVIDALKLERAGDRGVFLEALRDILGRDPAGVSVHGMTGLGLVELTRRRRGNTLASRLLEPPGEPKRRADGVAAEALRALIRSVAAAPRAATNLRAAPDVVAALQESAMAAALRMAEARCGTRVTLVAEAGWPRERVEIEAAGR